MSIGFAYDDRLGDPVDPLNVQMEDNNRRHVPTSRRQANQETRHVL